MKYAYTFLFSICLLSCTCSLAQNWTELGTGANALNTYHEIFALCSDPSGNIYTSPYPADTVVMWNGAAWQFLPPIAIASCGCSSIMALCSDAAGNIYAAGSLLDSLGNSFVAKWDGASWSEVGGGITCCYIYSLIFDSHGNLYAAGTIGDSITNVAKWDGATWSFLGAGSTALRANNFILTLCVDPSDNLYAGGYFTDAATSDSGSVYVAKWNGADWSELGSGVSVLVAPLLTRIGSIVSDKYGNIYAGGFFSADSQLHFVAMWNGTTWSWMDSGASLIDGFVSNLCLDTAGMLYAAGNLVDDDVSTPGGFFTYIAKWDGSTWSKVGGDFYETSYLPNAIQGLVCDHVNNIYATGSFLDTTVTDTAITPPHDTVFNHPRYVARYGDAGLVIRTIPHAPSADIYPNPTNDYLNISLHTQPMQMPAYSLYNCMGQMLMSGALQGSITDITIASLSPGIYELRLSGSVNEIFKVVKE